MGHLVITVNWMKLTHLFSFFFISRGPFVHMPLLDNIYSINFILNMLNLIEIGKVMY